MLLGNFQTGFPFSITIWLVWPDQGQKYAKFILEYYLNFGFKIQPVDRIVFLQIERTFLVRRVHQKLAFFTLNCIPELKNASK